MDTEKKHLPIRPMKSLRNFSGFFFNPPTGRKRPGSIQIGDDYISEPLFRRMSWFAITVFLVCWGCMFFFIISILTGTHFEESHLNITSPIQQQTITPEEANDQIQNYWDSGGKGLAVILVLGYYVAPISTLLFTGVAFFAPMTQSTRYLLICRLYMLSKMAIGPFILLVTQCIYADLVLERELPSGATFHAKLESWIELGLFYQCMVYMLLNISIRIIYVFNGIDPPAVQSKFRLATMVGSMGCLIGFFVEPYYHTAIHGMVGDVLLQTPNEFDQTFMKDGFDKLPFLYGLSDYSFYFWFWVIFPVILSTAAVVGEIAYNAFSNTYTLYANKGLKWFYVYDVILILKWVQTLGQEEQNEYQEENSLKMLCAQAPEGMECYDKKITFDAGYYWLFASVILFYIDDLKNMFLGCYEGYKRRQEGEIAPYTSLADDTEGGTTRNTSNLI